LLKSLLSMDRENFYKLYAFNLRNRQRFSELQFPSLNYEMKVSPIPQRLITLWWLMFNNPSLEQVVGDCDLYHLSEVCIQPTKKAKTVAFVHDLTTLKYPQYHANGNVFLHRQRFKNLSKVDGVLTNSEATKGDIIDRLDIHPDKIFVTHLGADDHFRPMESFEVKPVLQKYQLHKPYILFVGTLEPRKNIPTLIRAFNQLKLQYQIPHQLVLAGQKGWLYHDIFKEIEASPFQSDIRHLGYVLDSELPALMNGASAFCYPSFYEGFGLPILEAMQCGTPVVTSSTSSLPEVGGDACLYAHPESFDELSEQLFKALNDIGFSNSLSKKGIERAQGFSWDKCAVKTLEAYSQII
ncbi:glycosyltransferase family 4 protein, partial [Candidatus Pacearchaeota archaeon]|nr:glycosyltransferase family 4 protein [Candidatus Pacearchaeota archaeon]